MKNLFYKKNLKGLKKLRRGMFLTWSFSLLIPVLILLMYNYAIFGNKTLNFFTNPEFITKEIYQFEHLTLHEFLSKEINNIILASPENILKADFKSIVANTYGEDSLTDTVIAIRKNNSIETVNILNNSSNDFALKKILIESNDLLTPFKPGNSTNNKMLFEKSGYVVFRQIDFYFSDKSEGSVFILRKFTDIPSKIAHTIAKNILLLILSMMVFHSFVAYRMSQKVISPINDMINATTEVRNGNYKYRISPNEDNVLSNLSNSLNEMIVDLDKAKEYQNKIEESRNEFISSLSHDIKTPLTSIKIHAEAIKDKIVNTEEKMDKYINNILKKIEDADTMLEELKIFNELETGIGNYVLTSVKFDAFVEDIIDEMKYEFQKNHVCLKFINSAINPYVNIDINKMKRVIWNMVNNSIKYGATDPLEIDFLISDYGNDDYIKLTIKDNGIGVPEDKLDSIFEKYYRVEESRDQNKAGSGLGLAIAKKIIQDHNGTIYAKSCEKLGLEIVMVLKKEGQI